MNNQAFIAVLTAVSSAIATAMAGIVLLPLDDTTKAVAVFALSIVSTFLSGLLKPPMGPQVPANPEPRSD